MRIGLKRLFCRELVDCYFDMDNDQFGPRSSVQHLSFVDMSLQSLADSQYFYGHFPSLRRLQISTPENDDSFQDSSLSDLVDFPTGQLHHLFFVDENESVDVYAQECSELRSLTCSHVDAPSSGSRFQGAPLIGLRLETSFSVSIPSLVESLEMFYSSGMIDSSTAVFLPRLKRLDGIERLKESVQQRGSRGWRTGAKSVWREVRRGGRLYQVRGLDRR